MLHMTVVLKANMKTFEWEECLCECYIWWLLFWKKWIWKHLCESNVYVNVTYDDCCSESEYENFWVRVMFMWMLHMTVVMKVNMKTFEWE
jgi:hypothetical protein